MMTTLQGLEDLPTTVLLDIIQYLSPVDRYRSMRNINLTLDAIIRYGTTHINLSNIVAKRDFDYHLEHILPDVITSLRSIKISNDFLFDKEGEYIHAKERIIMIGIIKKVQAKMNLAAYEKLEELTLENINATQLKLISEKIANTSQLKRLTIYFYGAMTEFFTSIYNNDVIRSKLKTLRLIVTDANVLPSGSSFFNTLPNLDYLTVDSCIIGNVPKLFTLVQNIKYLDICIWDFPYQSQTPTEKLTLPNLTCLRLKVDEIKWRFVEHLLKQCGQKLKQFTFLAKGYLDIINAENWKKLITNDLKQLIKLKFRITIWGTPIGCINLASFNTDFWHKLNIYIACDWMKGSSEEDGDVVNVYTVPFCQSYCLAAVSTVNVICSSMHSSYESIKILKVLMSERPFRNITRIYENVDSIILSSLLGHNRDILSFLNISVNCNNIHHIGFQSVRTVLKPQIFFQLLQQCPNLYSLRLHSKIFDEMTNNLTDEKICSLLNKMIKHIQFNDGLEQEDFNEQATKRFAQTFTNLEQLYVRMKSSDDILKKLAIMIHGMKMLNKIFIKNTQTIPNGFIDQIRQSIVDLKECYIRKEKSFLFIWR